MAPTGQVPAMTPSDYRALILANCRFLAPRDAKISLVTAQKSRRCIRALVLRTSGDRRAVLLGANAPTVEDALQSLYGKSMTAVQDRCAAHGFGFLPSADEPEGDEDDQEDDDSDGDEDGHGDSDSASWAPSETTAPSVRALSECESPYESLSDGESVCVALPPAHPSGAAPGPPKPAGKGAGSGGARSPPLPGKGRGKARGARKKRVSPSSASGTDESDTDAAEQQQQQQQRHHRRRRPSPHRQQAGPAGDAPPPQLRAGQAPRPCGALPPPGWRASAPPGQLSQQQQQQQQPALRPPPAPMYFPPAPAPGGLPSFPPQHQHQHQHHQHQHQHQQPPQPPRPPPFITIRTAGGGAPHALPPAPPPAPPPAAPPALPSFHPPQPPPEPQPPRAHDVRLAIRWPGRGEQRMLGTAAQPTRRALQGLALRYVRAHPLAFGFGAGGTGTGTGGAPGPDGTRPPPPPPPPPCPPHHLLQATLRAATLGRGAACHCRYDLTAYASDDLGRLFGLAGPGEIPLFEVEVQAVPGPPFYVSLRPGGGGGGGGGGEEQRRQQQQQREEEVAERPASSVLSVVDDD